MNHAVSYVTGGVTGDVTGDVTASEKSQNTWIDYLKSIEVISLVNRTPARQAQATGKLSKPGIKFSHLL